MQRLVAGFVAVVLSCAVSAEALEKRKPSVDVTPLVSGNTQFACDLYAQLASQDGNLFYSPYSISSALALTYLGAGGQTADEMKQVLHFEHIGDNLHAAFGQLNGQLGNTGSKNCQLVVANKLWAKKGLGLTDVFKQSAQATYGAPVQSVDFAADPNAAAQIINQWVGQATQEKITKLLEAGDVDPMTELVLTNAIYFKGQWTSPFHASDSAASPFTLASGQQVQSTLMHQTADYRVAEIEDLTVLELSYEGGKLAMIVLLPKRPDGLAQLEAQLSADRLAAWLAALKSNEVSVSLPRFKMKNRFTLNDPLESLGMSSLFVRNEADLSVMTGGQDLYVSKVIHEAVVEVNEEGTVAAAATAAVADRPSPLPVQFVADHPFLFLIRDQQTGSLLFVGRLADPSAGG